MTYRRFALLSIIILGIATGCGAPPQLPVAVATPVAPTVSEKLRQDDPESAAPTVPPAKINPVVESPAEVIAKQTNAHARAIEELLNAKQREDLEQRGVKSIEPVPDRPSAPNPETALITDPTPSNLQSPTAADVRAVSGQTPPANVQLSAAGSTNSGITPIVAANAAATVAPPDTANIIPAPTPRPAPIDPDVTNANDSLEKTVVRRAREYPRDLAGQLDYQLLLFLKDEQVPRAADVAMLATEDREVLTAMMDGLSNFRNAIRTDNNLLMNRKIRPLVEMSDRLRSRSDLAIPTATLCREVKAFGVYTPFDPSRFPAGVASRVIVYCEVENFSSQLSDKNLWQTRLSQDLVLYTESGFSVWKTTEKVSDQCRNRRRDFYTIKIIDLPANLNLGRYVLKVSIVDEQSSRVAETSIPISIVAK